MRSAWVQHGQLLLVERVIPAGNQQDVAQAVDRSMLVLLGGRERTAQDDRDNDGAELVAGPAVRDVDYETGYETRPALRAASGC